ncbi:MAG: DUF21 domain-containing protein, partial [Armatimonadetes bacterium]|nr:DUF21 domain-containing protein [Armatimonadota bacterium]
MEDPLISLSFIATAALACLIFVLSLSEAALLGANPQLLRRKADDGHHGAELAYQVVSSGDYLSSIIVGINLSVIVIATLATAVVHRAGAAAAPRRELFHLSIIAVLLALAELTPKTYGSLYANELAPTLAPFVAALTRVFALPVAVLTGLAESVLRLLRVPSLHERRLVTEEDIIAATDLGEESGAVEAE